MEYGCIGEKLKHSFSKEIHAKIFDYNYELKEIAPENLDKFMREGDFRAVNVTIPYKQAVIPHLDFIDETARKIGAVNTVVNKNGKLYGYNTDFFGMREMIIKNGIEVKNKKVLILGSGGTSKTAFAVAENLGGSEILKVSRNGGEGLITYNEALKNHLDAEIIINTTPCGMYPNAGISAIDIKDFKNLSAVIDAVYNPLRSKIVLEAKKRGITATGGLYMLVSQGVKAAEYFTDTKISNDVTEKIYAEMLAKKENIVLIGMPSCGKSTVGQKLADILGFSFTDTDGEIVKRENREIKDIFEIQGEKAFRDIESAVIKQISELQSTVIATGGGAILREENIDFLKSNGRLVFLDRSLDKLITTCDRPLSSDRESLKQRYRERYDIYCSVCDIKITADGSIEEVTEEIRKIL